MSLSLECPHCGRAVGLHEANMGELLDAIRQRCGFNGVEVAGDVGFVLRAGDRQQRYIDESEWYKETQAMRDSTNGQA